MHCKLIHRLHPLAMMLALSALLVGVVDAQDSTDEKQEKVDIAALMQEAAQALQNEDFAAAAKALKQVTEANKDDERALHLYGYALHGNGDLDEAIKIHKKCTKFDEFKAISFYNLGCAYSLQGKEKEAIRALHKSLDAGFDQLELFDSDSDLENAKSVKGYLTIAERLKNNGKRPKLTAERMVGSWKVIEGVRAGKKVDKSRLPTITIDKKAITIPAGPEKFVMDYKIDNAKRPAKIDMTITAGPAPQDSKALGIAKRSGRKMTLCYDPMGGQRPEKFESTEENGCFLFVMELEKDGKEDDKDGDDDDEDDSNLEQKPVGIDIDK